MTERKMTDEELHDFSQYFQTMVKYDPGTVMAVCRGFLPTEYTDINARVHYKTAIRALVDKFGVDGLVNKILDMKTDDEK